MSSDNSSLETGVGILSLMCTSAFQVLYSWARQTSAATWDGARHIFMICRGIYSFEKCVTSLASWLQSYQYDDGHRDGDDSDRNDCDDDDDDGYGYACYGDGSTALGVGWEVGCVWVVGGPSEKDGWLVGWLFQHWFRSKLACALIVALFNLSNRCLWPQSSIS